MQEQRRLILGTGALLVLAGAALALVRFSGEPPPARGLEAAIGAVAFGAVLAAPGVLALLALGGRPALLLPAAIVLVPLSFLSFALVTLPLLVPAALLVRACDRESPPRLAATTVVVVAPLVAALLALFLREDPRAYVTATGGYGTSDVVSYLEAALSLGCTALAVIGGRQVAG